MAIRTVAILGAGHGGMAAAADLTRRGFDVRLHGRRDQTLAPMRQRGGIEVRGLHEGFVALPVVTTDVAEAIANVDLIMLVVPSVAHETYARLLAGLIDGLVPLLLNPGHTGGGLHFLAELRKAGYTGEVTIGETVTLTYICRSPAPATVEIYSYTRQLGFAALPGKHTAALHELVQPVFPELEARSSVLETGMSNINAIFHPPGMLMNAGWIEHTGGNFLFYAEGITEAVGRVVMAVDAERLAVAKALDVPARSFLDIFHAAGLTTALAHRSGNASLACKQSAPNKSIRSPASLDHRYVHEDVGDGLVALSGFGRLAGVATPIIDAQVHLASAATGKDYWSTGLTLERMGLAGIAAADIHARLEEGL